MQKNISLCLWWGWARAFIHIWVLKYLEEENYSIEEVSGTSMGAIIAAGIALGMSAQEIYDFTKKNFSYWKLIDFSFGKGIFSEKIFKMLKEVYGRSKVSHTKIPLKIVATRLEDMQKVVFTNESIVDAVRASMSIPGIFTPHTIEWNHYIDGMLSENLPIWVLSWKNIIAVSSVMGRESNFWNTREVLTKAFNKANFDNEELSLLSSNKDIILIRPHYDHIDFFDFLKFEELVEIGYSEAKNILEKSS